MAHPVRKNTSKFRYLNSELMPDLKENLLFEWIVRHLLRRPYDALLMRVENLSRQFIADFIDYINKCGEENIPAAIKATKNRCSLFQEFCQNIICMISDGYQLVPITKDCEQINSDYHVRFAKQIVCINHTDEDESKILDVNITSNPRCYRKLYDIAILCCMHLQGNDIQLMMICLQSMAEIYKCVSLTNKEIIELEEEFLSCAEDTTSTYKGSELESLVAIVREEMRSPTPCKCCADLKRVRQHIDGYLYNHKWSIDDAAYSTASSGSILTVDGKQVPNIALIFSAGEVDYTTPIDNLIGYKSYYPNEPFPGMETRKTVSKHVPKTSSRGERWIHTNTNGRQDRGNYFERCMKIALEQIMLADNTYDQLNGVRHMFELIQTDTNNDLIILGTDIKSATDWEDHDGLLDIWRLFFREEIPDFLLELHSGEGLIEVHNKDTMEKEIKPYNQIRGIKCGTRSNFSIGLALLHHIVVRCTMIKLGLKDRDPRDFYDLLGDDINHYLRKGNFLPTHIEGKEDWEVWYETYRSLAYDLGFRVHDISEKGLNSLKSLYTKGEFAKQTWSKYGMISCIPYRLFWKNDSKESVFAAILWMLQYNIFSLNSNLMDKVANKISPQDPRIFWEVWNFAIRQNLFGIPKQCELPCERLVSDRYLAERFFEHYLHGSVMDILFNNRQRLTKSSVQNRIKKFNLFFEDMDLINQLVDWQVTHSIAPGKLALSLQKNQKFADSLIDITKDYYLGFCSNMSVFSEEDKRIINRALPYIRLSNLEIPGEDPVSIIMAARDVLKDKQPLSLSKRTNSSSHIVSDICEDIEYDMTHSS